MILVILAIGAVVVMGLVAVVRARRNTPFARNFRSGMACYLKYGRDQLAGRASDRSDLDDAARFFEAARAAEKGSGNAAVMLAMVWGLKGNRELASQYAKLALLYRDTLEPDVIKELTATVAGK
jgi:hypothetical protein